jgi:hypothetical protein
MSAAQLVDHLASGRVPIVLISLWRLHGEKGPHWVVVTGFDGHVFRILDPMVTPGGRRPSHGPVTVDEFHRITRYGRGDRPPRSSSARSNDLASDHLIVVEKTADFRWADSDTASSPPRNSFRSMQQDRQGIAVSSRRPRKVINLCRNYDYLSLGYYCSLLAEARGDRITPSVETILELQQRSGSKACSAQLDRLIGALDDLPRVVNNSASTSISAASRTGVRRPRAQELRAVPLPVARDRARTCGSRPPGRRRSVKALDPRDVDAVARRRFPGLREPSRAGAGVPRRRACVPRMDLPILHDPKDPLPPSNLATLNHRRIGRRHGHRRRADRKKDFSRLTQFDALFIRETTAVAHHTFKFAKKAQAEGMPVIDDPGSILRCTNKAFLAELLRENGIATPRTRLVSRRTLARFEEPEPTRSCSRCPTARSAAASRRPSTGAVPGHRAIDAEGVGDHPGAGIHVHAVRLARRRAGRRTDLRGALLHVRDHWQIIKHAGRRAHAEGRTEAVKIAETPPAVHRGRRRGPAA